MVTITAAAFAAGFLSFFSPCVFPVAAAIISVISGVSLNQLMKGGAAHKKAGLSSILFVIGFSLCFSFLGASSATMGKFLIANSRVMFGVAGCFLIVMGVALLDIIKMPAFFNRTKKFDYGKMRPGYITAFLAGIAFAFAWTPCLGPVLASLLIMAAAEETALKGMTLLFVYSLGLGLPFIVYGFVGGLFLNKLKKAGPYIIWAQRAIAVIIILVGLTFIIAPRYIVRFSY